MTDGEPAGNPRQRMLVQDVSRLDDVEVKHDRVRELLIASGADALLLQDPVNIAWFTAGTDIQRHGSESCHTSVFVTDEARLFATNAVDSIQIFEREAFGLGFQLKQREWFQPHDALVEDLSRGRKVVSDSGVGSTSGMALQIASLRLPMTPLETGRMRKLSRVLVHAVEVTASNIYRGMTEAAVAGQVSHRLVKRTVVPVRIQVCADGRNERYRHWGYGQDPIENYAVVSCVARRWGLHCAVSRTIALDRIPDDLRTAHQQASLMHATGMYFSRQGQTLKEIWPKVRRIYEKFGLSDEWQQADQADVLGYRSSEAQLTPESDFLLQGPMAIHWHPSVSIAMQGDSVLSTAQGLERLTQSSAWPRLTVVVKGHDVPCPAILKVGSKAIRAGRRIDNAPERELEFEGLNFGEEDDFQMDSVWEMDAATDQSVFEDEDDSAYSESVLE